MKKGLFTPPSVSKIQKKLVKAFKKIKKMKKGVI